MGQKNAEKYQKRSSNRFDSETELLLDSAAIYSSKKSDKAIDFIQKALEKAIENNDKIKQARCYAMIGDINSELKSFDLAAENYNKAKALYSSGGDDAGFVAALKKLGKTYYQMQENDLSLEIYITLLENARKRRDVTDRIYAKNQIANLYFRMENYNMAIKNFTEVLQIEEERNNKQGMISAYDNLGNVYLAANESDKAMGYFNSSKSLAEELDDAFIMSQSLNNISNVYQKNEDYSQELNTRQQALDLNTDNAFLPAQTKENYEIGNIYLKQNDNDAAIEYLEKTVELSEGINDLDQKGKALQSLSKAYNNKGDYDKAMATYKKYVENMDSLLKQREDALTANLEINSVLNKKLQNIEMLEKDKELRDKTIEILWREQKLKDEGLKVQRMTIYSLIGVILIMIVSSYLVFRSLRQKKRANMLLALKSYRSQMNPHFIFNALNSVNVFIAKSDERSANKYLSEFSKLMRMVLENSKHDFISLSSEIQMLELYLSLEHFRFKEKFDYEFKVDPALDADLVNIPPMIIQPYIENSIWHGLRYREDKGTLAVNITSEGSLVKVVIEDDGIGRTKSRELKTKNQKEYTSTGMKNIENRIRIINELHRSNMHVDISDLNADGTGTRVIIKISCHEI